MEYIHTRYNARVKIDDKTGKKSIHKHGLVFQTFTQLLDYERTYDLKDTDDGSDRSTDVKAWEKAKGEY